MSSSEKLTLEDLLEAVAGRSEEGHLSARDIEKRVNSGDVPERAKVISQIIADRFFEIVNDPSFDIGSPIPKDVFETRMIGIRVSAIIASELSAIATMHWEDSFDLGAFQQCTRESAASAVLLTLYFCAVFAKSAVKEDPENETYIRDLIEKFSWGAMTVNDLKVEEYNEVEESLLDLPTHLDVFLVPIRKILGESLMGSWDLVSRDGVVLIHELIADLCGAIYLFEKSYVFDPVSKGATSTPNQEFLSMLKGMKVLSFHKNGDEGEE